MNLNKIQFNLLQIFADDHDYQMRLAYSGRGMFGKECIGFVTSESPFALGLKLGHYLREAESNTNEDDPSDLFEYLQNVRTDSMGMDTIMYFPNIQMPDELVDEEDELGSSLNYDFTGEIRHLPKFGDCTDYSKCKDAVNPIKS